ncbi:hypothetical protein [Phytoactinopolyspora mesophila]|uniref:Uncharacterized protein n=1 Tax=Phytoactinopolyspora mesophila TaxID=2650750 RepID=A0A7K3MAL1_9ACTN|nr:hypothetical protein [Phytoactinopolyspora mesophila]NDL60220.1 hypothetical protein [Phytoactinopolyspora mesophila]
MNLSERDQVHTQSGSECAGLDDRAHDEDRTARQISGAVLAGRISEPEGRWRLAAIVYKSDVCPTVAAAFLNQRDQVAVDLTSMLRDLVITKVVGTAEQPSPLNLRRIVGGTSFRGWMRQFARGSALSLKRDLVRARRRNGVPVAPVGIQYDDRDLSSGKSALEMLADKRTARTQTYDVLDAEDARIEAAIDTYTRMAPRLRGYSKTHLAARTLRAAFRLPDTGRIVAPERREQLRRSVEGDVAAAARAVRHLAAGEQPDDEMADLAAVFDGWSNDELDELAHMDPHVAHQLVLSAVTPWPPPKAKTLTRLRQQVTALTAAKGMDSRLAREAVTAFAASVAETNPPTRSTASVPKCPETLQADQARWAYAAAKLVEAGFRTLGECSDDIHKSLIRMLEDFETDHAST